MNNTIRLSTTSFVTCVGLAIEEEPRIIDPNTIIAKISPKSLTLMPHTMYTSIAVIALNPNPNS